MLREKVIDWHYVSLYVFLLQSMVKTNSRYSRELNVFTFFLLLVLTLQACVAYIEETRTCHKSPKGGRSVAKPISHRDVVSLVFSHPDSFLECGQKSVSVQSAASNRPRMQCSVLSNLRDYVRLIVMLHVPCCCLLALWETY